MRQEIQLRACARALPSQSSSLAYFCALLQAVCHAFAGHRILKKITGDGTQRTVKNRCLAGFCVGFPAIAFWEYGDFCSTQEDGCVCCAGDAMIGCAAHFVGHIFIGVPLDCCYVMCCWQLDARKFRRSPSNHGGGQSLVGAPTQVSNSNLSYGEATMIGMKPVGVAGP